VSAAAGTALRPSRIARTIHAWAGAFLSLLVIVIAASGALLVWKEDYLRLTIPAAREPFDPTPAALARVAEGAEAAFGTDNLGLIYFPTESFGLAQLTLLDESMAYVDGEGNVVATFKVGGRPEDWLFDLHHRLLLERTGLFIAGFTGLAVAALIVAGLVAYWPMRRGFKLGPRLRGLGRPELLLSHRNIGVVAAVPIVVAVLCGAALAFPDTAHDVLMSRLRNDFAYTEAFSEGLDDQSGADVAGWEPALARAQASFPDATIRGATWPGAGSSYREIRLQRAGGWSRLGDSWVYIDGYEGYMDIRIDARTLPPEERLFNTLYPVHTGRLGNVFTKLYVFAAGVAMTALGVLGLTAFLKRLRS